MSDVLKPAHLEICGECGLIHGYIVFSDGSSEEVTSRNGAFALVDEAFRKGRLLVSELPTLRYQIVTSALPQCDCWEQAVVEALNNMEEYVLRRLRPAYRRTDVQEEICLN